MNVGPGTADNASNNRTATRQLAERLTYEAENEIDGEDVIGCLYHVVNLAANDSLKPERTCQGTQSHIFSQLISFSHFAEGMEVIDYPDKPCEGVPLVWIVGETEDRLVETDVTDQEEDDSGVDDDESENEEMIPEV